jgi:hypothetical protein
MSSVAVLRDEVRCARKVMLRDPMAVFVTVALPLLYLFWGAAAAVLAVRSFGWTPVRER